MENPILKKLRIEYILTDDKEEKQALKIAIIKEELNG
jgi:hypothetical protein